ncbi:MAG: tRNA (N(6)-L-threonylcarbamoyladenosine(37)-C(2))-methylthiotransferase MtaB [Lachnospiraceae bacterium]|nr:tRNA (N(6)-L-threonylcarbamoyladenosine(37)-C(2))-methylthiotransferase MtaB [Lachnospiraceae bacterium]
MKRVALHNLGCKVNAYELDVMRQMLQEEGYKIVPFDEPADIYIVNTCTVTNIADRKSRQMLHKARKQNREAVVVAVGCYVQTGKDACEDESIDLAIGNHQKNELIPILETFLQNRENGCGHTEAERVSILDPERPVPYEEMTLRVSPEHTRAFLKIQDGCNQFCSYCIIPYVRGRVRSRRPEAVCQEAMALADTGCREIVLTGIHLSSYGMDLVEKRSGERPGETAYKEECLLRLIEKLHEIKGIERIRLGSLEPRIVTERFAERLSGLAKVCPHFHLSLQSGCDATLKRMHRQYLAGEYYEKVCILRSVYTDPAITTDVIVGFPGETEEEFGQTEAFLDRVGFYEMHVFKYSRRQGTIAAGMPGQISDVVKARRSEALLELDRRQSRMYRERLMGREKAVLFEEPAVFDGRQYMLGHTMEYVKAALPSEENLSNRILNRKITGFLQENIVLLQ